MRISSPTLLKSIGLSGGTILAASALLTTAPVFAQTNTSNFSFQSGYDSSSTGNAWIPKLNANGTSTETTAYQFLDPGSSTYSTTSSLYQPYSFNGRNITENAVTSGAGGTVRVAQGGFYVPLGDTVKLSAITFYAYVVNTPLQAGALPGSTSYVNPFTAGHFAVYNGAPASASSTVVAGDSTFTTNYLSSATFDGYREATNGSTATTRPIFALTLNLSSAATLTGGNTYYFASSFNVDHTIVGTNGSTLGDAFSVVATQTDNTFGQPNGGNGSDTKTNGGAMYYTPNNISSGTPTGWNTDQPGLSGNPQNPNLLDAFPFLLTGSISSSALPEADTAQLVLIAMPILGGVLYRRHRKGTRFVAA